MNPEEKIIELETQIREIASNQRAIQHDVNSMRQEMKNHAILSKDLEASVERLITLLEGDKIDPERGFIKRLIALERFAEKVKDTKAYLAGNIAMAVFVITALGGIISLLFKAYQFLKSQ